MTYTFTVEQEDMRRTARDVLARVCTPQHVRAAWAADADHDRSRWRQLAELGFLGVNAPVEHGGLGLDEAALIGVLEEAGYAGLPEPLLETAAVVVPVLRDHAPPEQRDEWLHRLVAGEAMGTAQLMGAVAAPYGTVADIALLELPDGLHLVTGNSLRREPTPSMDGARHTAALSAGAGGVRLSDTALTDARTRAAAAAAAVLNGVSRRLLDLSVAYAKEREQFGRPIGSFQAVKHACADMQVQITVARQLVGRAVAALCDPDSDDTAAAAAMAKSFVCSAAVEVVGKAMQLHGGIGYTWESGVHVYLKRATLNRALYGSPAAHRSQLVSRYR